MKVSNRVILQRLLAALFVVIGLMLTGCAGSAEKRCEDVYDLVVVGSDPEAVAAAVSGARSGLSVLMVDTRSQLGGLMTQGWLNTIDMNYAPAAEGGQKEILNKGIFLEFYNRLEGDSFDVSTAQAVFDDLVGSEKNLQLQLSVQQIKPVIEEEENERYVRAVEVTDSGGETKTYRCRRVIDATPDGDFAAAAGVPFSLGQADIGYPDKKMAATLVFRLAGVSDADWRQLRTALNTDSDPLSGSNDVSAWGFWPEMERYVPQNPRIRVRGLNIGRQNDGSILINALQIFDVDPLSKEAKRSAKALAEKELTHLVRYLNAAVPGLANAYLDGAAPELYIRESRHIYGYYRLTIDDVLENRDFFDRIAFGSYPVDMQATGRGERDYIVGNPRQYAVPFRAIIPQKVDNLLVVGRAASFDPLAHGSARVIPVGMATGQAAGAAAAVSIAHGMYFPKMAYDKEVIKELQRILNEQGMEIKPFAAPKEWNPEMAHWAYEGLKFVRQHALAIGGYRNDQYQLDAEMTVGEFLHIFKTLAEIYQVEQKPQAVFNCSADDLLTGEVVQHIFAQYRHYYPVEVKNHGVITRGESYMLIRSFLEEK